MFDTAKQSDQTINPFLNSVAYGQSKVKNFKAGKSAVITVKLSRLERDDPTGGGRRFAILPAFMPESSTNHGKFQMLHMA